MIQESINKIKNSKIRDIVEKTVNSKFIDGIGLRYLLIDNENKKIFKNLVDEINCQKDIWEKTGSDYWLLQIAYLVDEKKDKLALNILKKYTSIFGDKDIKYYLTISSLYSKYFDVTKEIQKWWLGKKSEVEGESSHYNQSHRNQVNILFL